MTDSAVSATRRTPGPCRCGTSLGPGHFRHLLAWYAWVRSGRCQACQDRRELSTAPDHDGTLRRYEMRQGALVGRSAGEFALLPFLFAAPGHVAWEARHIVRVGERLGAIDLPNLLAPMKDHLEGHHVDVATAAALDDPLLARRFSHCAVLVAMERAPLDDLVAGCPALNHADPVLHQLLLYEDADAEPLSLDAVAASRNLDPDWNPGSVPVEALRRCAWLGATLHLPFAAGIVLDDVLRHHYRPIGTVPIERPLALAETRH